MSLALDFAFGLALGVLHDRVEALQHAPRGAVDPPVVLRVPLTGHPLLGSHQFHDLFDGLHVDAGGAVDGAACRGLLRPQVSESLVVEGVDEQALVVVVPHEAVDDRALFRLFPFKSFDEGFGVTDLDDVDRLRLVQIDALLAGRMADGGMRQVGDEEEPQRHADQLVSTADAEVRLLQLVAEVNDLQLSFVTLQVEVLEALTIPDGVVVDGRVNVHPACQDNAVTTFHPTLQVGGVVVVEHDEIGFVEVLNHADAVLRETAGAAKTDQSARHAFSLTVS